MKLRFISFALLCMLCLTASAQRQRRDPFAGLKTLQEAYKDYFMIGVAVNQRNISTDEQIQLIKTEFNSITAENCMKPGEIHPQPGVWNFEQADIMVLPIFKGSGMKVKTCDSLMYGKNIVATPEAWEGYELDCSRAGGNCETAQQFIDCINGFSANPRPRFNAYSRHVFLEKYSEESVVDKFRSVLFD